MILTSVILALREVLEAALLTSLLLALSYRLRLSRRWCLYAIIAGLVLAFAFARALGPLSELFDGVGQEVANASLHVLITFALLGVVKIWSSGNHLVQLPWLMGAAVVLAVTREGSEVWLYYSAFIPAPDQLPGPLLGGAIGFGTGLSIGAILYYALVLIPLRVYRPLSLGLFALVSAGMSAQALNMLIQADLLPAGAPVWDTSAWLPESSVPGQILYALIGYEAQPVIIEVLTYFAVAGSVFLIAGANRGSGIAGNSEFEPGGGLK